MTNKAILQQAGHTKIPLAGKTKKKDIADEQDVQITNKCLPAKSTLTANFTNALNASAIPEDKSWRTSDNKLNQDSAQKYAKEPQRLSAAKVVGAVAIERGVFIVLETNKTVGEIKKFAFYNDTPLPHLMSIEADTWITSETDGEIIRYATYVSTAVRLNGGQISLAAITSTGRKPVFNVSYEYWRAADIKKLRTILIAYWRILAPGFNSLLPIDHPLRRLLKTPATDRIGVLRAKPNEGSDIKPVIRGCFDGVIDDMAHGWALNEGNPTAKVHVEIFSGPNIIARGIADKFREDLFENNIGNGEHHFRLKLSPQIIDGKCHSLRVRVSDTDHWLLGECNVILK